MKKLIITIFSIGIFFIGIINPMAASLYRTSSENGVVELSVKTEEKYINALDITLQLSGEVNFKELEWDSSLLDSYIKKYTYNDNVIRIYIATGDNNLINSTGNIDIGTIKVTTTGNDIIYNIEASKLIVVDTNYDSLQKDNVKNEGPENFVYSISSNNTNNNTNNINNNEINQNINTNINNSSQSNNEESTDNNLIQEDNSNESTTNLILDDEDNYSKKDSVDKKKNTENTNKNKDTLLFISLGIILIILVIVIFTFIFIKKDVYR